MVDTINYLLKCNYGKHRPVHNFHLSSRNIAVWQRTRGRSKLSLRLTRSIPTPTRTPDPDS